MSFVAEPGWYHEVREAFVPDRNGGGEGFFYLRLLKKLSRSVFGSRDPLDVLQEYASGSFSRRPCGETF